MIIYRDINDAFKGILKSISSLGSISAPRGLEQTEVLNYSFRIDNLSEQEITIEGVSINYEYAKEFFRFIMSGERELSKKLIELNKNAANFGGGGNMESVKLPENYSIFYGPRILEQLNHIVDELKRDKDTRRATISVLDGINDNKLLTPLSNGEIFNTEYPCTISLSFMIRDNRLHMFVNMRSQNMFNVFPYDFYNFVSLQKHILSELSEVYPTLSLGYYYSNIISAHYYNKFQSQISRIIS